MKNIKKPSLKTTVITATVAVLAFIFIINPVVGIVKTQKKLDETSGRPAVTIPVKDSPETPTTELKTETEPQTAPATPQTPTAPAPSSGTYKPNTTPKNPYVAPVCTKTITPYKTNILIASYLGSSTTTVSGGTDGWTETCTADSTGDVPYRVPRNPVDKNIYVGTGGVTATTQPRSSQPEPDQLDRIRADCSVQLSVHGSQEAYQVCVNTLARYFNIPL